MNSQRAGRARNARGQGALLAGDIQRAALALLIEGGLEAVTLRAVAQRAGIAAPSIYAHFANRGELLAAVVGSAFDDLTRALQDAAGSTPDPTTSLRAVCAAYLEFAVARPAEYAVMFQRPAGTRLTTARPAPDLPLGGRALGVLVAALTACAAAGNSLSTDPPRDAVALWTALHGYALLHPATPGFPWPDDLPDVLVERLGLLAPAGRRVGWPSRPTGSSGS